jgi:stage V sporulation protein SpoVS
LDTEVEIVVRLSRAQVDAIAARVIARLRDARSAEDQLVDAAALARALGVSRSTVYEHAADLGAIRLGNGRRPRLRFDLQIAHERWTNQQICDPYPIQTARTSAATVTTREHSAAELLPIGHPAVPRA